MTKFSLNLMQLIEMEKKIFEEMKELILNGNTHQIDDLSEKHQNYFDSLTTFSVVSNQDFRQKLKWVFSIIERELPDFHLVNEFHKQTISDFDKISGFIQD